MLTVDAARPAPAATVREPQISDRADSAIDISTTTTANSVATIQHDRTAYLLQELRCAALRARLAACEIDSIGVALRASWINVDTALEWLHDECPVALFYIRPI